MRTSQVTKSCSSNTLTATKESEGGKKGRKSTKALKLAYLREKESMG